MRGTIPKAKYKDVRASKQMTKRILQVKKELLEETNLQIDILYHAAAIALNRYHGWTADEICNFFHKAEEAGEDCTKDFELSMIELCWEELGIELMAEGIEKRWFEVSFLDSEKDLDRMKMDQFKYYQFFKNQIPWVPAQITASILIALYRAADWKPETCGKFISELEEVKFYYKKDPEVLREQCFEECGLKLQENFWVFEEGNK